MKSRFYWTHHEKPQTRKAVLVGVQFPHNGSVPLGSSLDELEGLAQTAFYLTVARLSQRLNAIHPKTLLGSGKIDEILQAVKHHAAEVVIFDEDLSPAQNRNLENALKCRVIDRSWLILEIFNDHAHTREAKTQVELARLKYALPRLTRMWGHLSRQRGGIGLRDVGETQIQLDRRLIRDQITKLERKLKQIDRDKITQRKSRRGVYRVALVGYTNVGKSTLMNRLTGAQTEVADQLFATLDSTIRKIQKNFPYPVLLADTVGLINKLPHDLVASFKSTLDEVREADLLLKVIDVSHPDYRSQMDTVDKLLNELGAQEIESVRVLNKIDRLSPDDLAPILQTFPDAIPVSSREGTGIDDLRQAIVRCYEKQLSPYFLKLNYPQGDLIQEIRKHALVVEETYAEEGILLHLRLPPGAREKIESLLKQAVSQAAS